MSEASCGHNKKAIAKGLCPTCYQRQRRRSLGVREQQRIGGTTQTIRVVLPDDIVAELKTSAAATGSSISSCVRRIVMRAYNR